MSDEPRRGQRVPYGTTIATARRLLAERGAISAWELTQELAGADSAHALFRLVKGGTAVQVRGSSLYALPHVCCVRRTGAPRWTRGACTGRWAAPGER